MASLQRIPRKPSGAVILFGPDGVTDGETLMCSHCQMHWVIRPGSGTERGWCWRCAGPLCGKKACMSRCIPWEMAIEAMESRRGLARMMERVRQL